MTVVDIAEAVSKTKQQAYVSLWNGFDLDERRDVVDEAELYMTSVRIDSSLQNMTTETRTRLHNKRQYETFMALESREKIRVNRRNARLRKEVAHWRSKKEERAKW